MQMSCNFCKSIRILQTFCHIILIVTVQPVMDAMMGQDRVRDQTGNFPIYCRIRPLSKFAEIFCSRIAVVDLSAPRVRFLPDIGLERFCQFSGIVEYALQLRDTRRTNRGRIRGTECRGALTVRLHSLFLSICFTNMCNQVQLPPIVLWICIYYSTDLCLCQ